MAATTPVVFDSARFVTANNRPIDSAQLLADAVVQSIKNGDMVAVDFSALRVASSSYFNVLLSHILDQCGHAPFVQQAISFRFLSNAQKTIFDRSYAAVVQAR